MAVNYVKWGVGTVKVGDISQSGNLTVVAFESECEGAVITHEYSETGEERTMLDGQSIPASATRADGFTAQIVNNLDASGLYNYLENHDLSEQEFEFVPNTAHGGKWVGIVQVRLPAEIGSDEFGNPIVSEIEWPAVGKLDYVPPTPPAGAVDEPTTQAKQRAVARGGR